MDEDEHRRVRGPRLGDVEMDPANRNSAVGDSGQAGRSPHTRFDSAAFRARASSV
jgi:hypothetical protein